MRTHQNEISDPTYGVLHNGNSVDKSSTLYTGTEATYDMFRTSFFCQHTNADTVLRTNKSSEVKWKEPRRWSSLNSIKF